MTQPKRYRSKALRSLHEVAEDLHDVGVIDKATMRHFDLSCLTPVEILKPEAIKHIREQSHIDAPPLPSYASALPRGRFVPSLFQLL